MFRILDQPNIDYKESIRFYNPVPKTTITGGRYWKMVFNGSLSELQYDIDGTKYLFSAANGCTLSEVSGVVQKTPSLGAISDGTIPTNNSQYVGSGGNATPATIKATFNNPILFNKIWIYPQSSGTTVYSIPGTFSVSFSEDDISYSPSYSVQISSSGLTISNTTLAAQGFTSGQLKSFIIPIP